MHIPEDLQHFPLTTLIVLTDEQEAKCFIAGGDAIEEVESLSFPREKLQDNEGAFASSEGTHVGSPSNDEHDTPRKKKFARMVAEQIATLIREGHAERIRLVSPPEFLHLLEAELPKELRDRIDSILKKDLMKFELVDVLKRIFERPEA